MQLETIYTFPGMLLLARNDEGEELGCVGLRFLGEGVGEVRRLYVRDTARGAGLGRSLMAELSEHGAKLGLSQFVLNTLPAMVEAVGLYESLGYRPIEPYVDEPVDGTLYFGAQVGEIA